MPITHAVKSAGARKGSRMAATFFRAVSAARRIRVAAGWKPLASAHRATVSSWHTFCSCRRVTEALSLQWKVARPAGMTQPYGDAENLESLWMLWQMDADGHLESPTEEPSNFDGPDWRREKLDIRSPPTSWRPSTIRRSGRAPSSCTSGLRLSAAPGCGEKHGYLWGR